MMRYLLILYVLWFSSFMKAQITDDSRDQFLNVTTDSLYREDQIYVGLSFNLLGDAPRGFDQNGFSGGLHIGFIRDMPFNKRRNKAFGIGLGIGTNSFNTNLLIDEDGTGGNTYTIIENIDSVDRNRLSYTTLDLPIQYRWRTSTQSDFTFWRIYTGVQLSYMVTHKALYGKEDIRIRITDLQDINTLRYTATLTIGNGGFNAFLHYDLNTLFNDNAVIEMSNVNLQPIKFGVAFFLL